MNRIHILTLFYGLSIFNGMVGMTPPGPLSDVSSVLPWQGEIDKKVNECNPLQLIEYRKNTLNKAEGDWIMASGIRRLELTFHTFASLILLATSFSVSYDSETDSSYQAEDYGGLAFLSFACMWLYWAVHLKTNSNIKKACYALQVVQNKEKLASLEPYQSGLNSSSIPEIDYESLLQALTRLKHDKKEVDYTLQSLSSLNQVLDLRSLIVKKQHEHNSKKATGTIALMTVPLGVTAFGALLAPSNELVPVLAGMFGGSAVGGFILEYNNLHYRWLIDILRSKTRKATGYRV